MMKHLYIKKVYGGLGLEALITGGLIGVDGIQAAVMVDMVAGGEEEDTLSVGVVVDLGVVVAVVDLVGHLDVEDLVEAVVEDLVEAVVVEAVEVAEEAVVEEEDVKLFY